MQLPSLETERLILRPFLVTDAADIQRLAGERAIADTTLNVPHPYEDGMAEAWISEQQAKIEKGDLSVFAITLRTDGALLGSISLRIDQPMSRANLGYWIGKPHWGTGYGTEAALRLVQYGFDDLKLNRLHAEHLDRNPASGRVLQKIGMVKEGIAREHTKKWDKFENLILYGLLREDWDSLKANEGRDK